MSEKMVQSNQIPHADDSALADLVGEAKSADEQLDWDGQQIRIDAVKLAIAAFEKVPDPDLISIAATIERYILRGYSKPEKAADAAAPIGGAKAFVENEDGTVTAV